MSTRERLTIGELAKLAGVPVKTVRVYSDEGPSPRPAIDAPLL